MIVLAGTHHEVGHDQLRFLLQLRMLLHVGVQVLLQRVFPRGVLRQVIERDHEAVGGIALRPVAHEVEVAVLVGDGVVPALEVTEAFPPVMIMMLSSDICSFSSDFV